MNIPYGLPDHSEVPSCQLGSIWKVQANDTYHVTKNNGFDVPGVFITYEGKGMLTQDNASYELHAGTYFIVQEGVTTSYRCHNNDWKFYFIDFNSLAMPRFLQLPLCVVVSSGKIGEALQKCERLIETLIEQPLGCPYATNILLQEILLLFSKEQSVATMPQHKKLNKIILYIHKHLDQAIRVEELVQLSGLARTTFYTRFRDITGLSPSDYMLKLKLESAKVSLETTTLSVKEIAANLQFYDEFHFSKLFKRKYGLSPSSLRRSYKTNTLI
ncbi:AraC family transcriptional regulator [Paenibacillus sp. LjRoot153]|uniref:AraC family transcriptional regulator n=1 Tax=Paenibacillus sp. LjRoot153 TaxID=3342270 RepID=UPI003ECFD0A7